MATKELAELCRRYFAQNGINAKVTHYEHDSYVFVEMVIDGEVHILHLHDEEVEYRAELVNEEEAKAIRFLDIIKTFINKKSN